MKISHQEINQEFTYTLPLSKALVSKSLEMRLPVNMLVVLLVQLSGVGGRTSSKDREKITFHLLLLKCRMLSVHIPVLLIGL